MPRVRDLGVSFVGVDCQKTTRAQDTCACTVATCGTSPGCVPTCKTSKKGQVAHSAFTADAVAQLKTQLRSRIGSQT